MKNKNLQSALAKFNSLASDGTHSNDFEIVNPEHAAALKGGEPNCPKNATCGTFCGAFATCGTFSVG